MQEAEPENGDSFNLDASIDMGGGTSGYGKGGGDHDFSGLEDLSFNFDSSKEVTRGYDFEFGHCGDGDGSGGADFSFDL